MLLSSRSLTLLALPLIAAVAGCAVDASPATSDALCADARAHVTTCLGVEIAESACNADDAAAILAEPCSAFGDDKSDRAANLLCRLGVYSACSVPGCGVAGLESSCAAYIDREDCAQCDYYLCRDAQAPMSCGDAGYYQGFGYAYCLRYMQVTTPHMTPVGRAFMHDVRRCLMRVMESDIAPTATCTDVRAAAFASHEQCYVDAGFCNVGLADRARILATVSPQDLDYQLMLRTSARCLTR